MRLDRLEAVTAADGLLRASLSARLAAFSRAAPPTDGKALKPAAVAITVLEEDGEAAFLLTRRAKTLRSHGGQWALPGGRCDAGESAVAAALRELDEELGLRREYADVLGTLDDYPTRSGYLITPVVVWAGAAATLRPNPAEVASVHCIPLHEIAGEDAVDFITIPESDRPVIRMHINGGYIHAPTAALIYQFREVIAGRATRVADLDQPTFAWR